MSDQLYIWTKYDENLEPHRTSHTAETIEEYDWTNPEYFEKFLYFFADIDGNTPDIAVAEVPEATQTEITELCNWLYSQDWGRVGGPLHIITDDGNVEDNHLAYCLKAIDENPMYPSIHPSTNGEKEKCRLLIELLQSLTVGGRYLALEAAERSGGAY